jgi:hypothetical protein
LILDAFLALAPRCQETALADQVGELRCRLELDGFPLPIKADRSGSFAGCG